ncbi:similar to FAD linked oxidase domain protein [Plenodomus lingam JN3]|uniref:Similar to FAD linked oxidase domain protein n=1 Tax=Leptosphaeria maculans (strain JN3 / isolate v23.1.3 / race Av1-4-5-6-7-8) TaxID=985895 RepID=E4ZU98_LEPMJ|nr:similar to FAD linked oxidase domain protein [Plenodomus lingam JN3]CBX94977.1 similar to FAD linked oxidase domain protein [Plenodomus lingam JN3]
MGSATAFDYSSLKKLLGNTTAEVLTPDDGQAYESSLVRWSEHCIKRAAAVVKVKSADDVSATLAQIRAHNIPFTVRGGGHSTSGAASIEDGIVIDLSSMRKVTVDPQTKTVTAEGGTIWEDVDFEAAKYDLAAVGGTVNHTGVGGLTLGGGYGYLSGRYGLTIDNLVSANVVLASGEQVVASATSHPDLFWAIRGAGQNFGVTTAFTFQGHDQKNPVFAGPLVFPTEKLPQIVEFANKFHATNNGDQAMIIGFSAPPPANVPVIMTVLFCNGTEEEGKAFYGDLFKLGPIANHTSMIPYKKLNSLLNDGAGFDGRKQFGGGVFKAPLQFNFVKQLHTDFTDFAMSHEGMNSSMLLLEMMPYKKVMEISNEEMSFSNRGEYYNVSSMVKWFDPAFDAEVRTFSREMLAKATEKSLNGTQKEKSGVGLYSNYAPVDADPKNLFGANVKRLEELKHKYDPDNLFRHGNRLTPRPRVVVN